MRTRDPNLHFKFCRFLHIKAIFKKPSILIPPKQTCFHPKSHSKTNWEGWKRADRLHGLRFLSYGWIDEITGNNSVPLKILLLFSSEEQWSVVKVRGGCFKNDKTKTMLRGMRPPTKNKRHQNGFLRIQITIVPLQN